MRKLVPSVIVFALWSLASSALWSAPAPLRIKNDSKLALSISKKADLPGGGAMLTCTFQNPASKEIALNLEAHTSLRVVAADAKGQKTPLKADPALHILIHPIVKVPAGQSYSFDLPLDAGHYALPASGNYSIQVVYENLIRKLNGSVLWSGHLESNAISLSLQ